MNDQEQRIRQILGAAEDYAGHDFTCQECGLHPFLEDAIYAVLDGRPVPAYDFLSKSEHLTLVTPDRRKTCK